MKKLRGLLKSKNITLGAGGAFEAEEIVLELEHDRQITIRRTKNGIQLFCDITRKNKTANAQFVIRAPNFGIIELSVGQIKYSDHD